MDACVKNLLKQIIPPAVTNMLRRTIAPPAVRFTGKYDSWEAARAHATGYDGEAILQRVAAGTRMVVSGRAAYERDSVTFDRIEYSWPLLASLLQVALERGSLRVVDFGGSLGSTWRQNKVFLERLKLPIHWHVVEQENFVALGRSEFCNSLLRFSCTITDACKGGVDVVLFCSSLCYVRNPDQCIREAAAAGASYLIIDRLPVIAGDQNRIALQSVREPIYTASYPIHMFSRKNLIEVLLYDWRIIEEWECDLQPDPESRYFGFFLEKKLS